MGFATTLIRAAMHRDTYGLIRRKVSAGVDSDTQVVLKVIGAYHGNNPNEVDTTAEEIILWLRAHALVPDDQAMVEAALRLAWLCPLQDADNIIKSLADSALSLALAELVAKYNAGDCESIADDTQLALDRRAVFTQGSTSMEITLSEELYDEAEQGGVLFRLPCLNTTLRPVEPGTLIVVAAAVNSGKTTFVASEVTHMIAQMPLGKSVYWFNNEGAGSQIMRRCVQSALGMTEEEIKQLRDRGELMSKYSRVVGGLHRVRMFDAHAATTGRIEQILASGDPGVIVFDMLDNVKHSFGSTDRPETGLEAIYQWARELGVKFGAIVVATSQLSADGYNTPFPDMRSLKGAKIGKQGAADVIITLGQSGDADLPSVRYIGTPKVKRPRSGTSGTLRAEVRMDLHRGRLVEDSHNG